MSEKPPETKKPKLKLESVWREARTLVWAQRRRMGHELLEGEAARHAGDGQPGEDLRLGRRVRRPRGIAGQGQDLLQPLDLALLGLARIRGLVERVAPVPFSVVCFRLKGADEPDGTEDLK